MREAQGHSDLWQEILYHVTCSVCYNVCVPEVMQCSNGHMTCKRCISSLRQVGGRGEACPVCRQHGVRCRNLFADQVIQLLDPVVPCPNEVDGCVERHKVSRMKEHAKDCLLRPIDCVCPDLACGLKLPRQHILTHFYRSHTYIIYYSSFIIDSIPLVLVEDLWRMDESFQRITRILRCFTQDFFVVFTKRLDSLHVWVSTLLRPSDLPRFSYVISICKQGQSYTHRAHVLSVDKKTATETIGERLGLEVTIGMMNTYQVNGQILCKVKIVDEVDDS